LGVLPAKEKALQQRQGEEHVVGVVSQGRGEEGELLGDVGVGAGHAAGGIDDRVGRAVGVAAGLGEELHGAPLVVAVPVTSTRSLWSAGLTSTW
jgi:hypothetical protein